ncbi:MAG: hypothetical protein HUU50_14700 [Candidatus Brocadiae bacterium]|nr:hypothetical protein [Candidatus Brocadiia bacterium]
MEKIDSYDPDLMVFRSGGGCLILFGLPFLLSGCLVIALPFLPQSQQVDWFTCFFGLPFFLVGVALVFGRSGILIDKRMNSVTSWWGLLFPLHSKVFDLKSFIKVTITKEIRRSKNSTYTVYPVRLAGEESVSFGENTQYEASRKIAEEIAKFIFIPLSDASSDVEIIREPDKLDESVRDKILRTGEAREIPPTPKNSKLLYDREGEEIRLEIPPMGWHPIFYVPIVFGIIFSCILFGAFSPMLFEKDLFILIRLIPIAVVSVPFIIIFGAIYRFASKRTIIHVSPKILQVQEIWALGKNTKQIPVKELEELRILSALDNAQLKKSLDSLNKENRPQNIPSSLGFFGNAAILARSDRVTIQFGTGLSKEEVEWLHAVIENTIAM